MKRLLICLVAIFLILVIANHIYAEIVTFDRRYFVDRSNIIGYLYNSGSKKGNKIQVGIMFGSGNRAIDIKYSSTDKWDWDKVEKVTKNIKNYINKHDDIDPIKMLKEAGLSGVMRK